MKSVTEIISPDIFFSSYNCNRYFMSLLYVLSCIVGIAKRYFLVFEEGIAELSSIICWNGTEDSFVGVVAIGCCSIVDENEEDAADDDDDDDDIVMMIII